MYMQATPAQFGPYTPESKCHDWTRIGPRKYIATAKGPYRMLNPQNLSTATVLGHVGIDGTFRDSDPPWHST